MQAEDELAAIGMVIGAAWNGARAFTATSGPGVSLMSEFLGLAYFAEIPAVLIDVQRAGPSTGMPTRTQQADLMSAVYASHGDTKHVVLIPSTPKECFDFSADALDLADRLQTPVIIMSDLELGMNEVMSDPLVWDDARRYDRGKVYHADDLDRIENFGRYVDVDGDGIGYRTYPGTHPSKGSFFTRGTSRDEYARYTEDPSDLHAEHGSAADEVGDGEDAGAGAGHPRGSPRRAYGIMYYGTTSTPMQEALDLLAADGIHLDTLRIRAVPFAGLGVRVHRHITNSCSSSNRIATRRCA